ncbi:kinase-like domain-containing protein [Thamnocephalis sphaerospora]|uniref:Kinase-like domain-containing protein n=1 Tax=Thamnocephalis sphaerospora TaxID=78915 RepID=A0A4P9XIG1_9FUNG|nr:kinase-like domain-containing protein [Thamnocephalis sphaerospora]|eukprot:RKP05482.1 kinase-like domain-containing protein [Thamnocephalis sphaerospora]
MRIVAIASLAIVATIAPWFVGVSHAIPTPGANVSTAHNRPDIPGITIEQEISAQRDETYTALARYKSQPGFLKCTTKQSRFERERDVLSGIHARLSVAKDTLSNTSGMIVGLLEVFAPSNGYYCLLLERLDGITLGEYSEELTAEQCDAILPGIFKQLIDALKLMHSLGYVHGDIKPQNVIVIEDEPSGTPRAVLIDFDGAQYVGNQLGLSVSGTYGYRPPEDYLGELSDQYKRDSWMLGATLYATLVNMPPYGFICSPTQEMYKQMSKESHAAEMVAIANSGANNIYPIGSSKNTHLLALMHTLMTCKIKHRPTVSELDPLLLHNLVNNG